MSAPFVAVCPSCSAKLKLKAAPASGKKLKCPKCEKVFAPKVPKGDADEDPWDLPDESSQSSTDDEWGDDGGESSFAPARSRRVPTVSRSSGSGEFGSLCGRMRSIQAPAPPGGGFAGRITIRLHGS